MTTYRFTITVNSEMSEEVVRKQLERQLAGYPCGLKRYHAPMVNASYTRNVVQLEADISRLTQERDEAIEKAWKQGWSVGQGDIGENCERSWLMSRTHAALKGDKNV